MTSTVNSDAFRAMVRRAVEDPAMRGAVIWFPEKVVREYGLTGKEADAVIAGSLVNLELDKDIHHDAELVFDLHDLHSGE